MLAHSNIKIQGRTATILEGLTPYFCVRLTTTLLLFSPKVGLFVGIICQFSCNRCWSQIVFLWTSTCYKHGQDWNGIATAPVAYWTSNRLCLVFAIANFNSSRVCFLRFLSVLVVTVLQFMRRHYKRSSNSLVTEFCYFAAWGQRGRWTRWKKIISGWWFLAYSMLQSGSQIFGTSLVLVKHRYAFC